jgi:hypothetical protein
MVPGGKEWKDIYTAALEDVLDGIVIWTEILSGSYWVSGTYYIEGLA